jgi:hypothetical protein
MKRKKLLKKKKISTEEKKNQAPITMKERIKGMRAKEEINFPIIMKEI